MHVHAPPSRRLAAPTGVHTRPARPPSAPGPPRPPASSGPAPSPGLGAGRYVGF
jgi:hypothetical protein